MVLVEEGCQVDIEAYIMEAVTIVSIPRSDTVIGSMFFRGLRKLREVVIPEGVETVGDFWFWYADVERVTIPASAKEIGNKAFCDCKHLRQVTFADDS